MSDKHGCQSLISMTAYEDTLRSKRRCSTLERTPNQRALFPTPARPPRKNCGTMSSLENSGLPFTRVLERLTDGSRCNASVKFFFRRSEAGCRRVGLVGGRQVVAALADVRAGAIVLY